MHGVKCTDEYWKFFSNRFKPALTEEVVLCDREKQTKELLSSLLSGPQQINIVADSVDEVIAFVISSIRKADPKVRLFLESRTLIVDTQEAGRILSLNPNLILILNKEVTDSPGALATNFPIIVPLSRKHKFDNNRVLDRPSSYSMGEALTTMGYSRSEAMTLARGFGRSLTALSRHIPGGSRKDPNWIGQSRLFLPALIAGAWDAGNNLDKEVIELLSIRYEYKEYERELRPFLKQEDSPFDCEGSIWKNRAPMDAFIHIGNLIDVDYLNDIKPIFSKVFGDLSEEPDPNDLVSFSASQPVKYSEWLREGLATTLLLIAVWEKQADLAIPNGYGQRFADEVMRSFPGLNTDYRLLTSLRNELPLLAEAAPVPFLDALEYMLEGDGELILPIFDEVPGYITSTSYHTGVLWALETLAWSDIYFNRVSLILARLAEIDPGGSMSNRPISSLTEILLLWHPGTNATLEARLSVLDQIIEYYPDVAWVVLQKLLPEGRGVSFGTETPKLRETSNSTVTYAELWKSQEKIVDLIILMSADSVERVHSLISHLVKFRAEARGQALKVIDDKLERSSKEDKELIWKSLREEVRKHEYFNDAQWALSSEDLVAIKLLLKKHSPEDPIVEISELFDNSLYLSRDNESENKDRIKALQKLKSEFGLHKIIDLANASRSSYLLISAIEEADFTSEDIKALLDESFNSSPGSEFTIFLSGAYRSKTDRNTSLSWIKEKMSNNEAEISKLLLAWPVDNGTWATVRRLGEKVEREYWVNFHPRWVGGSKITLLKIILNLLKYERSIAALQTAMNRINEIPTRLVLRILDGSVSEFNSGSVVPSTMIQYEIGKAFENLDERDDIAEMDIALREYSLFPLIEHQERTLKLHSIILKNPIFFNKVIRDVYKAKNEDKKDDTLESRERWKQAYSLLSSLESVPGFEYSPYCQDNLASWVAEVLELGKKTDREEITKSVIGRIFAHAPDDELDKAWPHRFIRDEIEKISSNALEEGLQIERFNMRGVTTRNMSDGGNQERVLANKNREYSAKATKWPRTYKMLNDIADNWDAHAEREDLAARQWGLRS
ncbi:hypothetical protein [Vreelandella sp. EE22]